MKQNQAQTLPFKVLYHLAEQQNIQMTMVGEPCLPMRPEFLSGMQEYLAQQQAVIATAREYLQKGDINQTALISSGNNIRAAEHYGDPQGEKRYRERVATTLNKLYKLSAQDGYKAEEILFTAGATGSLSAITQHINRDELVVIPFPCHFWHHSLNMFPMFVGKNGFTAEGLEQTLAAAKKQHGKVKELRLCDPHNPIGYATSREIWEKVAVILRRPENQHIEITLDEAYAEVAFKGHISLVEVAPDLKDRITLIRTVGKGFSATGYRVGIAAANKKRIQEIMQPNFDVYFKVPPAIQAGYTKILEWYAVNRVSHHQEMRDFYQTQVNQVMEKTKALNIAYKSKNYSPQIFYALMDLSELKGLPLSTKAKNILGTFNSSGTIENDVDISAYFLAEKNVALFPMSYFLNPKEACILRLTCGQGPAVMDQVMQAVATVMEYARSLKPQANY